MIKFRSKEDGILKINDLLLQGYSKEDLREQFGITTRLRNKYDPLTKRETSVLVYQFNGKEGTEMSDVWDWKEKLIIYMLK